jgi:hypothetical protein
MTLAFHPTARPDLPAVCRFLGNRFRVDPAAPFLEEAHVEWKYYRPHPYWTGSRSFVYETDADIAAHVCAWPFRLVTIAGTISVVHPIDWAASPKLPGIGTRILRQMLCLSDVGCSIGGTAMARKVIARSGFEPFGDMKFYARPLRPIRQTMTHQRRNWKLPARLARNIAWTLRSNPPVPKGWTVEQIEPEGLPDSVLPRPHDGMAVAGRSRELLAYFLACPAARHRLFLVTDRGTTVGYFLLSFAPGQARICDAFTRDLTSMAWGGVFALAIRAALREASASEITAASSLEMTDDALEMCGFRRYQTLPIMLFDARRRLEPVRRVHLQMIDSDSSFLHDDRPEYRT